MKNKITKKYLRGNSFFSLNNSEAFIWSAAIILLFFINISGESHFTLCPLKNIGLDFCPGCGLGSSIHHLLHLNFQDSYNAHPLGIFAVIILIHRIGVILKNNLLLKKISAN